MPVQQLHFYSKLLPGREFIDISGPHRELRSVKSAFELERLRLAGAACCAVFAAVPEFPQARHARDRYRGRNGMPVAQGRQRRLRPRAVLTIRNCSWGWPSSAGAASYGFVDGPVSGRGLSARRPTDRPGELVRENEPILLDYCFVHQGYISDMARVFVFGALDAELQRAFDSR